MGVVDRRSAIRLRSSRAPHSMCNRCLFYSWMLRSPCCRSISGVSRAPCERRSRELLGVLPRGARKRFLEHGPLQIASLVVFDRGSRIQAVLGIGAFMWIMPPIAKVRSVGERVAESVCGPRRGMARSLMQRVPGRPIHVLCFTARLLAQGCAGDPATTWLARAAA